MYLGLEENVALKMGFEVTDWVDWQVGRMSSSLLPMTVSRVSGVHTPSLCQRLTVNRKMTPNVASNVDRMSSTVNAKFLRHRSSASWGPGCYDRLFKQCAWVNRDEDGGASLAEVISVAASNRDGRLPGDNLIADNRNERLTCDTLGVKDGTWLRR